MPSKLGSACRHFFMLAVLHGGCTVFSLHGLQASSFIDHNIITITTEIATTTQMTTTTTTTNQQ